MPNFLRGGTLLHDAAALNTDIATDKYAYIGSATNVVIYIVSDTTTTMAVQAVMNAAGTIASGLNTDLSTATWCFYAGSDNIAVSANVPICIDVSPFAPQYLRLLNLTGGTNITTLTALVEANG